MPLFRALLPAVLLTLQAGAALAAEGEPIELGRRYTLRSKVLGEDRGLLVSLPASYAQSGSARYPVLYVLDGEAQFAHATATAAFLADAGRAPELIVVGVTNTDRTRDLTPPFAPTATTNPPDKTLLSKQFPTAGGADRFLEFLVTELQPHIEAKYRTQPYRILFGHSFGALFAVHAALTRPESFHAYLGASPSLWWNDRAALKAQLQGTPDRERVLVVSMGSEGPWMQAPFDELGRALRKKKPQGFRTRLLPLKDDDHGSTPLATLHEGLRTTFEGWRAPLAVLESGELPALEAHFAKLTQRYGFPLPPPERDLNAMGYGALQSNKVPQALLAFRRAVELYGSPNSHDSLGDALEAAKDYEAALKSVSLAVELAKKANDPLFPAFQQHLQQLQAKAAAPR